MGRDSQNARQGQVSRWLLSGLGWLMAVIGLFLFYRHVTDKQVVGFLHDDGVYALTGKALALGQGYKLLNLPLPNLHDYIWQVKYPIFYPLLLSLGWLINPSFPQNLGWLHGLTIACATLAIPLLYQYCRQAKRLGIGPSLFLCLLVATNFQYIYYATALMSETPYFLWSLLALWLAEIRHSEAGPERTGSMETDRPAPSPRRLAAIILASTLAFHTRTVGLALIIGIFLSYALRKQWKTALIYAVSCALLTVIPWAIWVKGHSLTLTQLNYPVAYVYGGYGIEYGIKSPHGIWGYMEAVFNQGVMPLINNLVVLMLPLVTFWLAKNPLGYNLLSLALAVMLAWYGLQHLKSRQFNASGLYVACYLLGISLWMYPNQAIRFLLVILPWLWLYSFRAVRLLWQDGSLKPRLKRISTPKIRWIGAGLVGLFLLWPNWPGYQLLERMRGQHLLEPSGKTAPLWSDYQDAFTYFRQQAKPTERIASVWDPVFYIYTGHPTFGMFTSSLQPIHGQVTPESARRLRASFIHYDVKYIVVEPFIISQELRLLENPVATLLLQQFPADFQLSHLSPHGLLRIYRFQPVASVR